jgi:RNA polymerase sigma-70 factor (ECF subfamily)
VAVGETFSTLSVKQLRGHATWLRRLAMALVRDEASADDLVQNTLLAAVRRPPDLHRDVRPWFERVLRNFARQRFRGEARRERRETQLPPDSDDLPGADELLIRHEAARVVAGLVSELREPDRSTVLLHFAEGVQLKDIAARQGLPEGTVRRRLKDTLDELRGRLDDHYRGQRRDWRAMLLPLGRPTLDGPTTAPRLAAAMKGAILMGTKSKLAVIVCAALALWWGVRFWSSRPDPLAVVGPEHAGASVALMPARRGPAGPGATGAARRPAPPSFAVAASPAVPADLPSCEQELGRLRRERDDNDQTVIIPGGSAFEQMQPSPKNQRILAPIIDRILGAFQPKPEYTLECRVSRCRLTLLAPEDGRSDPWLKAVEGDGELSTMLRAGGGNPGWGISSRNVKDALSRKETRQSQLFFTVPARKSGQGHPFDVGEDPPEGAAQTAPWSLATCRDRVTALRQQLDVRRDEFEKIAETENDPQRLSSKNFLAAQPNSELTGKFRSMVAALVASGVLPATATAECRGESDCQLSFAGSAQNEAQDRKEQPVMDQLGQVLERNGYTVNGSQVRNRASADNSHPLSVTAETSILVRLIPATSRRVHTP